MKYDSPVAMPTVFINNSWEDVLKEQFNKYHAHRHPGGSDDTYDLEWEAYKAGYEQHWEESRP